MFPEMGTDFLCIAMWSFFAKTFLMTKQTQMSFFTKKSLLIRQFFCYQPFLLFGIAPKRSKKRQEIQCSGPLAGPHLAGFPGLPAKRLNPFFAVFLVVFEDEVAEAVEAGVVGTAVVGFGELADEFLEVGIGGDHEGGDRDLEFPALGGQVEGAFEDFRIEAETVFVVTDAFL